ncbi:MAG: hypothetical protein RJA19_1015 [Bacteroidota bacterium]|jgi:hypothetical protein
MRNWIKLASRLGMQMPRKPVFFLTHSSICRFRYAHQ